MFVVPSGAGINSGATETHPATAKWLKRDNIKYTVLLDSLLMCRGYTNCVPS